jgi:hypothetical protein
MTPGEHAKVWRNAASSFRLLPGGRLGLQTVVGTLSIFADAVGAAYEVADGQTTQEEVEKIIRDLHDEPLGNLVKGRKHE